VDGWRIVGRGLEEGWRGAGKKEGWMEEEGMEKLSWRYCLEHHYH
jgi:hypothetical protein